MRVACECHGMTVCPAGVSEAPARERPDAALSPEAERLNAPVTTPFTDREVCEEWCRASADNAHISTLRAIGDDLVARLLRSLVASTTLPREPSDAAIEAAFIAERDYGVSLDPAVTGTTIDRLRFGLRAAYAVDGSPVVASLAADPRSDPWALVCKDCGCDLSHHRVTPMLGATPDAKCFRCERCAGFTLRDSLAPTSLAEIPEAVEAALITIERLMTKPVLFSDVQRVLRAAEAARPPKGESE